MATARTGTYLGRDSGYLRLDPTRSNVRKVKCVHITTPATADDTDTIAVTLANYGLKNVKAIEGTEHTVLNSTMVIEDPTTSVTDGVLTITIGGSNDDLVRSFLIWGEEA